MSARLISKEPAVYTHMPACWCTYTYSEAKRFRHTRIQGHMLTSTHTEMNKCQNRHVHVIMYIQVGIKIHLICATPLSHFHHHHAHKHIQTYILYIILILTVSFIRQHEQLICRYFAENKNYLNLLCKLQVYKDKIKFPNKTAIAS